MTISIEQVRDAADPIQISGLQLSYGSATTVFVAEGQCRDSTDQIDIFLNAGVTINLAVNGINGLDTGTVTDSETYYVFVLADFAEFNTPVCIASLSSTAPVMPAGNVNGNTYAALRLIGTFQTSSGGAVVKFYQTGNANQRTVVYDAIQSVLSAGAATTFAAVSLAGFVPPIAPISVEFLAAYTPTTAGNKFSMRPTGSAVSAANSVIGSGVVASQPQLLQITVPALLATNNASVDYQVNASDALTLYVQGYTQFV
jgi:hypothetical protein